jgi:hypothetical protein
MSRQAAHRWGDEVVSLTHRPRSTPQKQFLFLSPVLIEAEYIPGPVVAGRIR